MRRDLTDPFDLRGGHDLEAHLKAPVYENVVIPEDFGPRELVADEHKIRRFAFAQSVEPFVTDADGKPTAPIGLLANDLLQMFTLVYAASQVVGLHTEEQLWFDRPVHLDDKITLSARYTKKFECRGQGHVVMEAQAHDDQGRSVLRHRGVEIMRTAPAEVAGRGSAAPGASRRVVAEADTTLPRIAHITADSPIGAALEPRQLEARLEQMALFSRLGEGITNIHSDVRTARRAGLDLPIMQGQQLFCHVAQLVRDRVGPSFESGGMLFLKFLKPVAATESFTVEGALRGIGAAEEQGIADLDVWIRRADGSLAAVGWAEAPLG